MAFTAWPTAGANSYSDVATADTYLGDRYGYGSWSTASAPAKQQALVTVTSILETMNWDGNIVSTTQDLMLPRTGLINRKGATIANTVIPPEILRGLWLGAGELVAGRWDLTGVQQGITALSSGGVSVSFGSGLVAVPGIDYGVPRVVYDQVAHLFAGRQSGLAAGKAFGTKDADGDDIEADYKDNDHVKWGVTEPL